MLQYQFLCDIGNTVGVQFLADVNAAFMLSGQKWRGLETTSTYRNDDVQEFDTSWDVYDQDPT